MNNSNHTPGPWTFKKIPLWTPDKPTTDGIPHFECCSGGGSEWLKTAKANARLVAGAPELLAALEAVVAAYPPSQYRSGNHLPAALESQIRAAIAIAKGGAS